MPKQKSSASSATKKKHARRAAARDEALLKRAAEEEQDQDQEQDGGEEEGKGEGEGEVENVKNDGNDDEQDKVHDPDRNQPNQDQQSELMNKADLKLLGKLDPDIVDNNDIKLEDMVLLTSSSSAISTQGDTSAAAQSRGSVVHSKDTSHNSTRKSFADDAPDESRSSTNDPVDAVSASSQIRDRRGKKIGDYQSATTSQRGQKKIKGKPTETRAEDGDTRRSGDNVRSEEVGSNSKTNGKDQTKTSKKKQSKKHAKGQAPPPPRKKQFIPPPKPTNVNIDPVDIYGLGMLGAEHIRVAPERIVTLRLLNKKDSLSVERGLEELSSWIVEIDSQDSQSQSPTESKTASTQEADHIGQEDPDSLVQIMPVWIHHLPKLLSHFSRKVRLLTCSIQKILLSGSLRLRETVRPVLTSPAILEREDYLSAQLCATFDNDRHVRALSTANWEIISTDTLVSEHLDELLRDLNSDIQEGSSSALTSSDNPGATRKLGDEERLSAIEDEERKLNHLGACLDAFNTLLPLKSSNNTKAFAEIVCIDGMWNLLDGKSMDSPRVRRSLWRTLCQYLDENDEQQDGDLPDIMKQVSSTAPLVAFRERDHPTQTLALQCSCQIFRRSPQLWYGRSSGTSASGSDSETSGSTKASASPEKSQRYDHIGSPLILALVELLQRGLYGNAVAGYPLIKEIIQTFPAPIKEDKDFYPYLLSSLWSAYTGAALEGSPPTLQAFTAFFISLIDLFDTPENTKTSGPHLITFLNYNLGLLPPPRRNLSVSHETYTAYLKQGLDIIARRSPPDFEQIWRSVRESVSTGIEDDSCLSRSVKSLTTEVSGNETSTALNVLLEELLVDLVTMNAQRSPTPARNEFMLQAIHSQIFQARDSERLREDVLPYILQVTSADSGLLLAFLAISVTDKPIHTQTWCHIGDQLRVTLQKKEFGTVLPLIEGLNNFSQERYIEELPNLQLDQVLSEAALQRPLQHIQALRTMQHVFAEPTPLVSKSFPATFLATVGDKVEADLEKFLLTLESEEDILEYHLEILDLASDSQLHHSIGNTSPIASTAAECAVLASNIRPNNDELERRSRKLAERLLASEGAFSSETILAITVTRLAGHVTSGECQMSVEKLCASMFRVLEFPTANKTFVISNFLPVQNTIAKFANQAISEASRLKMHIGQVDDTRFTSSNATSHASTATRSFIRAMEAWIIVLTRYRHAAHDALWLWPHCLLYYILISGQVASRLSNAQPKGISCDEEALAILSQRIAAYVCSRALIGERDDWQLTATKMLSPSPKAAEQTSALGKILLSSLECALDDPMSLSGPLLSRVIQLVTRQAGVAQEEQEAWILLARSWFKKDYRVSLNLLAGLKPSCNQASALHRWIGELIAELTTLRKVEVAPRALPLLRCLVAACDLAENFAVSGNRAIFLFQAFQRWGIFDSEEDNHDDGTIGNIMEHIVMAATRLIPFIQDASGSHWEYIFDTADYLIETSLENAEEEASVSHMLSVCEFMQEVTSRASVNKAFKHLVRTSYRQNLRLLQQLLVVRSMSERMFELVVPKILPMVGNDHTYSVDALELLSSVMLRSTGESRALAYRMCADCIVKQVESLITTAGFATAQDGNDQGEGDNSSSSPIIPESLLQMPSFDESSSEFVSTEDNSAIHILWVWNLSLEYLFNSTTAMRYAVTDQIRRSSMLSRCVLPVLYDLLEISDRQKGVDLTGWHVEDCVLWDVQDDDSAAVAHFAAYTFYRTLRAVPSLVRAEWEAIRNRQLSLAIESFTSKTFSPILIQKELEVVSAKKDGHNLNDEEMTVKVLANVNEYVIDEQPMELSIRIPTNFPLSPVEVKDTKRIAVPEATWRAWLLNIQLMISQQNGSIFDALALFKTNASRHFEGVEACAICYSVVSVVDRSMPTKRCRTCKQLFHPSCLYKWFHTSHGSSCPLCRSLF